MKSAFIRALMLRALRSGLKRLRSYMSTEDFKLTVDQVLDRVENHFPSGSTADVAVEIVTNELRSYFDIPDND